MVPPASDPAAELLGGLEHTCWPTEATWVLRGAGGRARAGLLWVWGIGRALCTGLALGSPDFISEPTRRAGIFLWGRLVTARCPPPAAAGGGNPAAHMRRSKTPTAKASPGRAGGARWVICALVLLDLCRGTKLPRRRLTGLKSYTCHLFPSL